MTADRPLVACIQIGHYGWHEHTEYCLRPHRIGTVYTPHSGRDGYSITSPDGKRAFMVTPDAGPGKFSPVRGWMVWKSDSLNTAARFPATVAGLERAIDQAVKLAGVVAVAMNAEVA